MERQRGNPILPHWSPTQFSREGGGVRVRDLGNFAYPAPHRKMEKPHSLKRFRSEFPLFIVSLQSFLRKPHSAFPPQFCFQLSLGEGRLAAGGGITLCGPRDGQADHPLAGGRLGSHQGGGSGTRRRRRVARASRSSCCLPPSSSSPPRPSPGHPGNPPPRNTPPPRAPPHRRGIGGVRAFVCLGVLL